MVKARQWVLKEQLAAWRLDAAFPLILAFSLGEKEGVLRPAWNSKADLTHPAAGYLAKRRACILLPEGEFEPFPPSGDAVKRGPAFTS
jgi:hypothetical protein